MGKTTIVGIMVYDRIKEADRTQKVLTQYGHLIRSRMGFHELSREVCSRVGTIILVVHGTETECAPFFNELKDIGGIEVQTMNFAFGS